MYRARSHSGFTLVEILAVVVILGIASAMVIPQIASRDDLKVAAAARVLMADLMYAQNRAISLQQVHYVSFSGQSYTVQTKPSGSTTLSTITHPITKTTYTSTFGTSDGLKDVTLNTVNFGSGKTILAFDEMGIPYACSANGASPTALVGTETLVLRNATNTLTMTIAIERDTGELRIQ
jgi:prepilin-type N-terminal cleavage/methylation domain-containing protein